MKRNSERRGEVMLKEKKGVITGERKGEKRQDSR